MDNNWFKLWPSSYLNIINRIPDPSMRGDCLLIAFHCLNEDGIPDDDAEISWITGLPIERIKQIRPYMQRMGKSEDSIFIFDFVRETLEEKQQYMENKSLSGKQGGRPRKPKEAEASDVGIEDGYTDQPASEKSTTNTEKPEETRRKRRFSEKSGGFQKKAEVNSEKQAKPIHADMHTDIHTGESPPDDLSNGPLLHEAIEKIFPGHANNWRTIEELTKVGLELNTNFAEIISFPAWLKESYPRKAISPFVFKDLIGEYIANSRASPSNGLSRNGQCLACHGTKEVLVIENDKAVGWKECEVCT